MIGLSRWNNLDEVLRTLNEMHEALKISIFNLILPRAKLTLRVIYIV